MNQPTIAKAKGTSLEPVCYICGREGPDSRDHVIPDCFFKSPRPADLLTLPAHYTCHNRHHDEYARGILSGLGSEGSSIAQDVWNTKTKRSFERSAPLRKSLQDSLLRKIDLISPAGLVFDFAPAIRIERNRFYPLMRKIVQGMYLHHTGELLPPTFRCRWSLNALLELSAERRRMLEASRFGLVYPEVFGCRYLIVNQGADSASVWWLCFYTDVVLRCYVPPRHLWSALGSLIVGPPPRPDSPKAGTMKVKSDLKELIERCETDTRRLLNPGAATRLGNWRLHARIDGELVSYIRSLLIGRHRDNGWELRRRGSLSLEEIVIEHRPDLFNDEDIAEAKRTLGISAS